eukprot:1455209-Amphidinium_carterae.1
MNDNLKGAVGQFIKALSLPTVAKLLEVFGSLLQETRIATMCKRTHHIQCQKASQACNLSVPRHTLNPSAP